MQLARLVGARRSSPSTSTRRYGAGAELGADYAFDSRDPEIRDRIAEVTGGRKLDVAFDAVGLEGDVRSRRWTVRRWAAAWWASG